MTRRMKLTLAATLLSGFAAACLDSGVAPTAPTTPSRGGVDAAVVCQVTVRTATLACGPATPVGTNGIVHERSGIEPDVLTLGGQGIYVRLTSSGTAYDGSSLFTTDVTLTNLLAVPMNTVDGATADTGGVKVFFNTGPSVTGGTGTVAVANPDGTGTFTATGQPFFKYSDGVVLASQTTTASKTWQFTVPPTVTVFAFTVYVTTKLPVTTGLTFAQVSAGAYGGCGVTTTGAAYCWGLNAYGQLGIGTASGPQQCDYGNGCSPTPVAVSGGFTWAAVSAGSGSTCGVTTGGVAYCWGYNPSGELGNGTTTNSATPVAVSGGHTWAAVSATGPYTTCGVTTAGAAYCWGHSTGGQLGNGMATGPENCPQVGDCSTTPVAVSGGLTWSAVTVGGGGACGLTTAGAAYCWGYNTEGELGNGTTTNSTTPTPVSGGHTFAALSGGSQYVCGVTTAGAAYCWGFGDYGQLGNGTTTTSTTPVAVSGGHTFAAVSAGVFSVCGVTTAGAAYFWGLDAYGEIGNGASAVGPYNGLYYASPVPVSGGLSFVAVSAGNSYNTCGVTTAGAAYCWGWAAYGGLGNGITSGPERCNGEGCSTTPVAVW
jgi:alpha-tubulin suppressor-like RCC1 family protein